MRRRDKRERRSTRRGYDRGVRGERGIESFATELGERKRERENQPTNQRRAREGGSLLRSKEGEGKLKHALANERPGVTQIPSF